MNEAYVTGRSAHDALIALRDVVRAGETEPIIDMYERAAWMSGASHADTASVIRVARKEKSH